MKKYRLALVGCGFLNEIVASQVHDQGVLASFELVGVLGNTKAKAQAFADRFKTSYCETIEELMATKPDFIAEAASVQSVKDYAEIILKHKSHLVVLSIGAFADLAFMQHIESIASEANQKVYLASGAVGGFDILRTASLMSPLKVHMHSKKSPQSLLHTPLNYPGLQETKEVRTVFEGSTVQAIEQLPTHVNVAVATALASAGPQETQLTIDVVPDFIGDEYVVDVEGEEVRLSLKMYSKTSAIAAWSVIEVLRNATASIVL